MKDFDPADLDSDGSFDAKDRTGSLWGADPELIEGDIFRMIITVPELSNNPAALPGTGQDGTRSAPSRHQVTPEVAPEVTPEVRIASGL